jgi:RNA polymerase sigma-70 factor (TIGR02960 family)
VTDQAQADPALLASAQAGDGAAFGALTGPFRRELHVHCYRMLGSAQDAEDALQETLVAAWRGIGQFEGRSSLRAWLYRIATNQCLNALRGSKGRALAARRAAAGAGGSGAPGAAGGSAPGASGTDAGPAGPAMALPEPATKDEPVWLEPYPDTLLAELPDAAPGPEARYEARESISLAFVVALQRLPPRQRAALVLRDALGYRAAEAAQILDCTLDTVNGSLKRARTALSALLPADALARAPLPGSAAERDAVGRFTDAFERGDVAGLVALLTDDAWLTMPPWPLGFRGPAAAGRLLAAVVFRGGTRRYRLIPARANGQPAFACYFTDDGMPGASAGTPVAGGGTRVASGHGLIVLGLDGARISGVTRFLDNALLPRFGVPAVLEAG